MQAQGNPGEVMAGLFVCFMVFLALLLLLVILFLLTLHRTQAAVSERNRELMPGLVWLTLIPIFGTFWVVYMVPKLSSSLRREFEDRGMRTADEGFGQAAGTLWGWGGVVSLGISVVQNIAQWAGHMDIGLLFGFISLPVSLGILICWIIYWVQMAGYGRRLREGKRTDLEADYDDEFPPLKDDADDRAVRDRHEPLDDEHERRRPDGH